MYALKKLKKKHLVIIPIIRKIPIMTEQMSIKELKNTLIDYLNNYYKDTRNFKYKIENEMLIETNLDSYNVEIVRDRCFFTSQTYSVRLKYLIPYDNYDQNLIEGLYYEHRFNTIYDCIMYIVDFLDNNIYYKKSNGILVKRKPSFSSTDYVIKNIVKFYQNKNNT